jgi:hypothetical protein
MSPRQQQPSDADIGRFEYDAVEDRWRWSTELRDLHGLGPDDRPTTELLLEHMVAEDRQVMHARFLDHLQRPGPYSCSYRLVDTHGRQRHLVFVGESEARSGEVVRLHGFVVDITEELRNATGAAVAASQEHRATIEQAKGALMMTFGVEEDMAFHLLRNYSNRHNVKLVEVADRLVAGLSDPAYHRDHPVEGVLRIIADLASPIPRRVRPARLRPAATSAMAAPRLEDAGAGVRAVGP